jgi:hypothetical protein
MTTWHSYCESNGCVQVRTVGDLVEIRDSGNPGQVLALPAQAWAEHEVALRAEGRQQAGADIRAAAAAIHHRAEIEAGVVGQTDHPFLLGCEYAARITEVRDEAKGTSE